MAFATRRYTGHPGELQAFGRPVTREQAPQALADLIAERLPQRGAREHVPARLRTGKGRWTARPAWRDIERVSDHWGSCRVAPAPCTGPRACSCTTPCTTPLHDPLTRPPYTTLYRDFLLRHVTRFTRHPRPALQAQNALRIGTGAHSGTGLRATAVRGGDRDAVS
jgi:deoxyribodipyrimidine photolyase-like uncharacterized protein